MEIDSRIKFDLNNPIGFENLYTLSRTVDKLFEDWPLSELIGTMTFLKSEIVALGEKNGFRSDETANYSPTYAVETLVRIGEIETFLCKLYEQRCKHLYKESRRLMQLDGY